MANLLKNQFFKLNSIANYCYRQISTGTKTFASYHRSRKIERKSDVNEIEETKPFKRKHRSFPLFTNTSLPLAPKLKERPKQVFDYFLVLDFEATCDSPVNLDPQEIIEFPVLKVNSDTFQIESTFHSYVRPEFYPNLTSFCTDLTGVIQSMVDNQPLFKEVYEKFQQWLADENILNPSTKIAFSTCGDPDLDYLFPLQCYLSGIEVPEYMEKWINVKRSFCEISPYTWPDNLVHMMKMCELQHSGDLHSGIDDARNVARVMENLADRGLVFTINGWIKNT